MSRIPEDPRLRAAAVAAGLAAASLMKRSRLARMGVAGGVATVVARRLAGAREPVWHDVPAAERPAGDGR